MHLGLAGLLHFVRNDSILGSRHCNKASAASEADVAIQNVLSLRGGETDVAIQDSKPLDCFISFAMTARLS